MKKNPPNQSNPRILFVSPFSSLYGGELCLYEAVTGMDRSRYDISVATGGYGPLVERLEEASVPVKIFEFPYMSYRGKAAIRFALRLIPNVLALARHIRRGNYSLVYNNSMFNPYGALAAWLTGVPCIWHIHDMGNNRMIRAGFTRLAGALSRRVIVVSDAVRRIFPEAIWPKIRLIYNGVNTSQFDPARFDRQASRQLLGIDKEQPVVLFVGRLHETKRPQDAVAAMTYLVQQRPDILLLLAGEGDLEHELRSQITHLGLEKHIRMLGYQHDVGMLLSAADVLLLPSGQEALGRVLAEAMAMATPVVSTRVGGIPELIGMESGILVEPRQPEALAAALDQIISYPEAAQRMGKLARQRVLDRFSLKSYVANIEAVVADVLGRNVAKEASGEVLLSSE